jgi:hypothetical protein
MIAHNARTTHSPEPRYNFTGLWANGGYVTQADDAIHTCSVNFGQNSIKRNQVSVNVRDEPYTHGASKLS